MIIITTSDHSLSVDGHAARPEGVPPGNNIICAAVSVLTLALMEGLQQVAHMEVETEERIGHVTIRWKEPNLIGCALLDTYLLGIEGIRDSYGEIEIVRGDMVKIEKR